MAKEITSELRKSLYGRTTVFMGPIETPTEQIVYNILYDTLRAGETVIWVCLWGPPSSIRSRFSSYELKLKRSEKGLWFIDATLIGDKKVTPHTLRCSNMDFVCLTMHVVNLLKEHSRPLVMLDNIGIMVGLERVDRIMRLMELLNSRIQAAKGGLVTVLRNNDGSGGMTADVMGLMDAIIRVEENRICTHMGNQEQKIPFSFSGGELILGSSEPYEDLTELFSLTPDEKKKLELEVEEKAQLYRELIGN